MRQQTRQRRTKTSFTLIEIMIAVSILALIAAGVGWHATRVISHHRFQAEAADICLALQEAQFISVIHQTECELLIYPHKGQLTYQLKTDEPLPTVDQTAKPLKESRFLTVNNAKSPYISLKILSSGRIEPTLILGLHQKDPVAFQQQGIWLDLQTPVQVKLMQENPQKRSSPVLQKPVLQ